MFTNEFKFNNSITTVLDDEGSLEDVQLTIGDDMVYIKQYNNDSTYDDVPDTIMMTPEMFAELLDALECPEGVFRVDNTKIEEES